MIILGITHLFLDATGYYFEVMTTSGAHEGIITAPMLYNRALGETFVPKLTISGLKSCILVSDFLVL
jgi:hypothetical protein